MHDVAAENNAEAKTLWNQFALRCGETVMNGDIVLEHLVTIAVDVDIRHFQCEAMPLEGEQKFCTGCAATEQLGRQTLSVTVKKSAVHR
jgi:hypothetical protein